MKMVQNFRLPHNDANNTRLESHDRGFASVYPIGRTVITAGAARREFKLQKLLALYKEPSYP